MSLLSKNIAWRKFKKKKKSASEGDRPFQNDRLARKRRNRTGSLAVIHRNIREERSERGPSTRGISVAIGG